MIRLVNKIIKLLSKLKVKQKALKVRLNWLKRKKNKVDKIFVEIKSKQNIKGAIPLYENKIINLLAKNVLRR